MRNLPFDKPGRFWRGNLHTHTTVSDGNRSTEDVCRFYRENGYDFLAITDHFMEKYNCPINNTRPFRTAGFTTIIGAELHSGFMEMGELWHILAVGLPEDFAPPVEGETGPQIAGRALAAGAFVAAAHPQWNCATPTDIVSLGDIHAIEVFNGAALDDNDRADSWHLTDILLARGHRYTTCATDDAHFTANYSDAGRGWVHVKAEALDPDALLAALKAGAYYSSTGPLIHEVQVIPGRKVMVRCSPAERVYVTGAGPARANVGGHGITEAEMPLNRFRSPYGRIVIRDAQGGRAWSNPFWFE